jgi:hypothetical protein
VYTELYAPAWDHGRTERSKEKGKEAVSHKVAPKRWPHVHVVKRLRLTGRLLRPEHLLRPPLSRALTTTRTGRWQTNDARAITRGS